MTPLLAIVAAVVTAGVALFAVRSRRAAMRLPSVSDEEFLTRWGAVDRERSRGILRERDYVAKVLGVPADRLKADTTVAELRSYINPVRYEVARSDLADDVREKLPETIGGIIDMLMQRRTDEHVARG